MMTEEQYNKYNEALKSIREYDGMPPIEDLIERPNIPLVPEMPCDSYPKPPSSETMTDLQAQAKAYAVSILNNSDSETFTRQEMYYALADAYEQGYIDCGTEGECPETQDEFFDDGITSMPLCLFAAKYGLDVEEVYAKVKDKVIDKDGRIAETVPHISIGLNLKTDEMEFYIDDIGCKWYDLGCCAKGLPGTPCERKGCMAYYPKESEER